jgi:hypothetical protein
MQADYVVIVVSLIIALIMFPMTWIARNVWKDLAKTRAFAVIGVASMVIFMVTIWEHLPD